MRTPKIKAPKNYEWRQIGSVSVDAGCLMVGDPCYTVGADSSLNKRLPGGWKQFCEEQFGETKDHTVKHPTGMCGLAVVADTAYGDGMYPVLGLYEVGEESTDRPHAMMVVTGDVDA